MSLRAKPLHHLRARGMRRRRRLQAQRINAPGFQRQPERDNEHATIDGFFSQGQVSHGHPQAARSSIQRQFIEIEGDVPIGLQRFAVGTASTLPIRFRTKVRPYGSTWWSCLKNPREPTLAPGDFFHKARFGSFQFGRMKWQV